MSGFGDELRKLAGSLKDFVPKEAVVHLLDALVAKVETALMDGANAGTKAGLVQYVRDIRTVKNELADAVVYTKDETPTPATKGIEVLVPPHLFQPRQRRPQTFAAARTAIQN